MKKKHLFTAAMFIGCVVTTGNSFAAGKIIVNPVVEVAAQNNSNFWKAEDVEISVNTYSVKPGIILGYETAKTQVTLDTALEAFWYDDQDTPPAGIRDASDDDYVGFRGVFNANHQLTDRLNLGFSDQLYVTRDPAQADANSNSINRDKYTINYLEPSVYYEFADKFGLLTKYRSTITDYEKDLEDSSEHRGIFDLYYNLNNTSSVYLDYQIWQRDYDLTSSDYTSNLISLNYTKQYKHFLLSGGGGYHHRSFDANGLDDLDMFSWNILVKREDPDSTARSTRSTLSLSVGQEMNDDGTGDQYFVSTYVRFEGGYRLTEKLMASLDASFQNSDYEESTRSDDTYLIAGKIGYEIFDYLSFSVAGGFESRDSNLDGKSYDDTFVTATLDFDYNLNRR